MKEIIDVVIPAFNRPKETFLTIQALLEANDDIRVILVNDGSTEKPDLSSLDIDRIIQIDLKQNYGQPKALNEGFKLVESEYVIVMDNDVVINDRGWIRKAINFLKTNKEAGLVCAGGSVRIWDDQTHSHTRVITSLFKGRDVSKFSFEVLEPKEDFTEVWRAQGVVNIFKTGIKADERAGLCGITFWIDILAKDLKNYVMRFDDGKHSILGTLHTEACKKITDIKTEIKKEGKVISLRLKEFKLKYPEEKIWKT